MSFYRHIKNVINDNDYFKIRMRENSEKENIYDLKEEDLNNNDINNKIFLSRSIAAENNYGNFREKINNKEQIIEQNYKNLSRYQNNMYNNKYSLKNRYKKVPNMNYPIKTNRLSGKRIYKSDSTGDALKNNFYLSQLDISNNSLLNNSNYYINYSNRSLGKKRTDVTDNNFIQIYTNKQNFVDYFNKNREIQNENKKITEEKNTMKKNDMFESRLKEQKVIKMENNYYNSLAAQNLLGEKKSKILYKNILDQQVKNNINDKLMNENLTYNDVIQNRNYLLKNNKMSERKFLNKNNFVEVNPYNRRNYFLGNSLLKNDIINNPQINFKLNKYIFPSNNPIS